MALVLLNHEGVEKGIENDVEGCADMHKAIRRHTVRDTSKRDDVRARCYDILVLFARVGS